MELRLLQTELSITYLLMQAPDVVIEAEHGLDPIVLLGDGQRCGCPERVTSDNETIEIETQSLRETANILKVVLTTLMQLIN